MLYIFAWGTNRVVNRLVGHNAKTVGTSTLNASRVTWVPVPVPAVPVASATTAGAGSTTIASESGSTVESGTIVKPKRSHYVCVTSERDYALCFYAALGGGRVAAKLGIGQPIPSFISLGPSGEESGDAASRYAHYAQTGAPTSSGTGSTGADESGAAAAGAVQTQSAGHTGSVKDIAWLDGETMLTCGFDKRLLVWGTGTGSQ